MPSLAASYVRRLQTVRQNLRQPLSLPAVDVWPLGQESLPRASQRTFLDRVRQAVDPKPQPSLVTEATKAEVGTLENISGRL